MKSGLFTRCLWYCIAFLTRSMLTSSCPNHCFCSETRALCNGENATSIPTEFPSGTLELYLRGYACNTLGKNSFVKLPFLQRLALNRCHLEQIERGAFANLASLRLLDIRNNYLSEIVPHTFEGLKNLVSLQLDNNKLRTLRNSAFASLNITKLSLHENAKLHELEKETFSNCNIEGLHISRSNLGTQSLQSLKHLKQSLLELTITYNKKPLIFPNDLFKGFVFRTLWLDYNGIGDTQFLAETTVDDLSLAGNPIGSVNFNLYPGLHSTRVLRLESTGTDVIMIDNFHLLKHLTQLYLQNNVIQTIPKRSETILTRLERLNLHGNILHCNCNMLWFKQWVHSQSKTTIVGAQCGTPFHMDVDDADPSRFKCIPPQFLNVTSNATLYTEESTTLSCSATGDPAPLITWRSPTNETLLVTYPSIDLAHQHTDSQLTMTKDRYTIYGLYTVSASNLRGTVTKEIHIVNAAEAKFISSRVLYLLCLHYLTTHVCTYKIVL